jgi:hypothetical protein
MTDVKLDTADAAELAETLQFLSQWLDRDPGRLGASLAEFAGHPAYGLDELHGDLERFVSSPWMGPPTGASRPPRTVVNAVRLMYAGAALELATLITIMATASSVKSAVLNSHPAA